MATALSGRALGTGVRPRRRHSRIRSSENVAGYLFMAPWILGFIVLTFGPMIASGVLSLTNFSGFGAFKFVGLQNYAKMMRDDLFLTSLYNTAYYAFLGVPGQLLVALILAAILNMKVPYVNFFRTAYYVPTVVPAVANVYLWVWILNYDYGLINVMLRMVGLPAVNWLFNTAMAKPALILMSLWAVGRQMVIFLAALQAVPDELLEAAAIDGATSIRRFLHVVMPLITPVIFLNLVIGIIGSFQVFTVAFIATNGGPVNATLFYVLYLYRQGFSNFRMGYASGLAWILFLIILVLTGIQFYLSNRWVYYESGVPR